MKKLKKGSIYIVEWEDTFSLAGWIDKEDVEQRAKEASAYIKTIGFYMGTFSNFATFASSMNTNPIMKDWGTITYIPVGCIKNTIAL